MSTLQDATDLINPRNFCLDETTDTLYVGLTNGDFTSVDVSNVSSMSVIDRLANISGNKLYSDMQIDTTNEVLFGCGIRNKNGTTYGGSLYSVDISDSANLAHLDSIERLDDTDFYFPNQMDVDTEDEYLFVACSGSDKLLVIDYSDPSSLTIHAKSSTSNFKQDELIKLLR